MPWCCAFGCSNNTNQGFKIYAVPNSKRHPERRKAWLAMINRLDFHPKKSTGLCEVHFAPSEFEKNIPKKLKPNAIPTIFSHETVTIVRKTPPVGIPAVELKPHMDHAYAEAKQAGAKHTEQVEDEQFEIIESLSSASTTSDPECTSQYIETMMQLQTLTTTQPSKRFRADDDETSTITSTDVNSIESYRWTGKAVRLLITLRREMDEQFERPRCKKLRLWDEIAMKMNDAGNYAVNGFVCDKKWRNLLSTYRRIKDKNQQDKSTWGHFDLLDDWLGQKVSVSPPLVELRRESEVLMDELNSSSSEEPFSDGGSTAGDVFDGLEMTVEDSNVRTPAGERVARRYKRTHFYNDQPPKWFEEFLKQRLADQNKRYELEKRRLALEEAQVKAMERLVAVITANLRKRNPRS